MRPRAQADAATLELPLEYAPARKPNRRHPLAEELIAFRDFGTATRRLVTAFQGPDDQPREVPTFVNEFWTAKQRQASSLHEISYRACFKPQLPRFFIERLTQPGDVVYDPFMGRGTTVLEAALLRPGALWLRHQSVERRAHAPAPSAAKP